MPEQNNLDSSGEDLRKLIEINNFINSERDTKPLLKIVLNYALQLSGAEFGFVLLLDEQGEFTPAAALNTSEEDYEKMSLSIARRAVEQGEIINSSDALSDERFDASESIVMHDLKSVLCLPIKSKNKIVGVFYLDNHHQINVFDHCNMTLLKAYCDQVGIALENARLISELKEAHKKITEQLSQTQDELAEVKTLLMEEGGIYQSKYTYDNIISKSRDMHAVFRLLDKVTETTLAIFIHGESGTGKELIAKALHYNNPLRCHKRFLAINCGAIPSNLMESELFGHKAGSFTGAVRDKKGMFEEAHGGTLFLDEIGELAPELQVKLLRVLQEGEVQRVGENQSFKVDVRIVSASLKDITAMVKTGKFREDLYYRLCQMSITLPPLRQRKEDIPFLAKHFVKKYILQNKLNTQIQIPPQFLRALLDYDWPGNVRELENLIHVACALQENAILQLDHLPNHYGIKNRVDSIHPVIAHSGAHLQTAHSESSVPSSSVEIDEQNFYDPRKSWRDYEAVIVAKCFAECGYNKKEAATHLDLSHSTLYKKIAELDLDDKSNPLYVDRFVYTGKTMAQYVNQIFMAGLKHHGQHPYAAIKQLAVSQGYFYKIIKASRNEDLQQSTAS